MIRTAKTHLSKPVARAEAGEEIVLARGKELVAEIVPVASKPQRSTRMPSSGGCQAASSLTRKARVAIESDDNDIFVSAVSAWEIATKFRMGSCRKLPPWRQTWPER